VIKTQISDTNVDTDKQKELFDEFSEIKDDAINRLKDVREDMLKTNFLLKRTELFQSL